MKQLTSLYELPDEPAVYALFGGQGRSLYVAYVGVADSLKQRIFQHLVRRDSSVATGTSAVGLNPDYVTEIQWWEHPDFIERFKLEAAELVAFDVLDPALRSRGKIQDKAKQWYKNQEFYKNMQLFLTSGPSGRLVIPTLQDALKRIANLEERVKILEEKLNAAVDFGFPMHPTRTSSQRRSAALRDADEAPAASWPVTENNDMT